MSALCRPDNTMSTVAILAQGTMSGWCDSQAFLIWVQIPPPTLFKLKHQEDQLILTMLHKIYQQKDIDCFDIRSRDLQQLEVRPLFSDKSLSCFLWGFGYWTLGDHLDLKQDFVKGGTKFFFKIFSIRTSKIGNLRFYRGWISVLSMRADPTREAWNSST